MSRYRFGLATSDDDGDLRKILAATPMEGPIAVGFRREPSWFAGAVVDGRCRQVIACRDLQTGRIIGFGCRSIREVYVKGGPGVVGYLSSLRVLPEYRNLGLLARGYAALRKLHADAQVPCYLTTIAAGNRTALNILTSGRAGLPTYHPAGAYHTIAVAIPRRKKRTSKQYTNPKRKRGRTATIRSASKEDLPQLLHFWATVGPRREFFPRLEPNDFLSPDGMMRGLSFDQLLLAEKDDRLVGTLAAWDQHSYRQSVVSAYHGGLGQFRWLYNMGSWFLSRPSLPRPGDAFRYFMGALPVVVKDQENVFAALLETLLDRMAGGPCTHFLLGLHEADPLLRIAQCYQVACYLTHLFLVSWPDEDSSAEEARLALDGRVPYLEAGSL
jgi:hypothetical protein